MNCINVHLFEHVLAIFKNKRGEIGSSEIKNGSRIRNLATQVFGLMTFRTKNNLVNTYAKII